VTEPPAWEPMPGNAKRKGKRNELGLVIADCCGPLVPPPGVAYPETGRARLNEPLLLGRGQNGETQRGKTLNGGGYLRKRNEKVLYLIGGRWNGLRAGIVIVR
jgi:hypothetical protein